MNKFIKLIKQVLDFSKDLDKNQKFVIAMSTIIFAFVIIIVK